MSVTLTFSRRTALKFGLTAAVAAAGGARFAAAQGLRPFTFIFDFLPYGEYSAFYVALEKGWYAEEGLDVTLLEGKGSSDTVKRILAGQGDLGCADFGPFVGAIANENAQIKGVLSYIQRTPLSIYVREDTGIRSMADLSGRNVATTAGNAHVMLFPVIAEHARIEPGAVNWVNMDGASLGPALLTSQTDGATMSAFHERRLQLQAEQQGHKILRLAYADNGLDLYAQTLFTRNEVLDAKADEVRAFLRATLRGMKYAWAPEHIEEGAAAVVKHQPLVEINAAIGAATAAAAYGSPAGDGAGDAWGRFDEARVASSVDVLVKFMKLSSTPNAGAIATNDFIS